MFNEVFINPKLEKLQDLETQQMKQRAGLTTNMRRNMSMPALNKRSETIPNLKADSRNDLSIIAKMKQDPLLKDQASRFNNLAAKGSSFYKSPLMERKMFIKKSDNFLKDTDNEELDETLPEINKSELQDLRQQLKQAG